VQLIAGTIGYNYDFGGTFYGGLGS
jgi:hypothetical protein